MTVQEQIDALLAEAAPLRLLADDEAEETGPVSYTHLRAHETN